jgi:hypothetical protein
MSQNGTQYKLVISCPGVIEAELNLIEKSVGDFNKMYPNTLGVSIMTIKNYDRSFSEFSAFIWISSVIVIRLH